MYWSHNNGGEHGASKMEGLESYGLLFNAWESYLALTDDNEELNKLEKDDISSPSVFNDRLNKIMNKVKYKVFGKVSFFRFPNIAM